jgi:recombinational DNA repair ATPase RecF
MKLAQLEMASSEGESPLFLLDDVTSELDGDRMKRLFDYLLNGSHQIWITTTSPRYLTLPPAQTQTLRVRLGEGVVEG